MKADSTVMLNMQQRDPAEELWSIVVSQNYTNADTSATVTV